MWGKENPEGQLSLVAHPSENKATHIRKALTRVGPCYLVLFLNYMISQYCCSGNSLSRTGCTNRNSNHSRGQLWKMYIPKEYPCANFTLLQSQTTTAQWLWTMKIYCLRRQRVKHLEQSVSRVILPWKTTRERWVPALCVDSVKNSNMTSVCTWHFLYTNVYLYPHFLFFIKTQSSSCLIYKNSVSK